MLHRGAIQTSKRIKSQLVRREVVSTLFKDSSRFRMSPKPREELLSGRTSVQSMYPYRVLSTSSNVKKQEQSPFKRWPVAMVECHGDYRAEAWLEDHIGGPLYEHQKNLPRLPIPQLKDTMAKLVPTMMPLLEQNQSSQQLQNKVNDFPEHASNLQQRLIERATTEYKDSSYLQHWWNTLGYLAVRDSVVINVSYFFHLADDPTLGTEVPRNVARAAAILTAVAEYRIQVCSGQMSQETIGRPPKTTPLCSAAFKYMFNACRIPHRDMDSYKIYDPSMERHVIVARNNKFYSIEFLDQNHQPLSLSTLQQALQLIIQMADNNEQTMPLGVLSSQDRDSWADARDEMLSVGGINAEKALTHLESGAFLLCLDNVNPQSRTECGKHFLYGGGTDDEAASTGSSSWGNRWYDKSVQVFVCENGKAGMLGEHSMMDGMPVVGLANHIVKTQYAQLAQRHSSQSTVPCSVTDIFQDCLPTWQNSSTLQGMVSKALESHKTVVQKQSLDVQAFHGYGSARIKSQFGASPDAFVQMAIQLATYRLWDGQQGATYEATQTRPFLHGRTETTRSVSPASEAFCRSMGKTACVPSQNEQHLLQQERRLLLEKAIQSHVQYIKGAAAGQGVDRHLLGLSLLLKENEQSPALYGDETYVKAKTWRVSTSHLSHPKFDNWGFGQVVPHGVGVGYGILPHKIVFNVTALKEHGWTSKLAHLLEESLLEMADLYQQVNSENVKSKL